MDSGQGASGSSAWGGFLKKAMEGVEQQLDRVLENPPPKGTRCGNRADSSAGCGYCCQEGWCGCGAE
jgi:hypothetical protein